MAIGAAIAPLEISGVSNTRGGETARAASVQSPWFVINDDAMTAVAAAGDLLNPSAVVAAQVHWARVPNWATKIMLRLGYTGTAPLNEATPVIRLIGAFPVVFPNVATVSGGIMSASGNGDPVAAQSSGGGGFSATPTSPNYATFERLDDRDQNAAGFVPPSAAPWTDGTRKRGKLVSLIGHDLQGCRWVTTLVETAAATATLAWIEAKFLN